MRNLKVRTLPAAKAKFLGYPPVARSKLEALRSLILETANELATVAEVEETLKWGEPSYVVKKGSTIRIDWKARTPDRYAVYFKCTSKLVPTFREVYGDCFEYEKNRAIVFGLNDPLPVTELKDCIAMALQYHTLKDRPRLGR